MEIIDLGEEELETYCHCLEDWSAEMREAGEQKRRWYERHRGKGLRVKLAREEGGRIVGMAQYGPAEHAPVEGRGFHYLYCIWVHGYREGVGDWRGKGIGPALLAAAEEDARSLGAAGMAAWGLRLPVFMRSAWFRRRGYRPVDREGALELLFKSFAEDPGRGGAAEPPEPPRLIRMRRRPCPGLGKVRLTCFRNGWCPAQNLVFERSLRVAAEFPGSVELEVVDTDGRENLEEWGLADGLFVDDRPVRTGPPPSAGKIRKAVLKELRRRRLAPA